MWRIIKAELDYLRPVILLVVAVWFALDLAIVIWGWQNFARDYNGTRTILFTSAMVLWFFRFIRVAAEKTNRLHITLPVTIPRIAVSRACVYLTVWLVMLCLHWGTLLAFRFDELEPSVCFDLIGMTGVILVLNAIPLIHRDLINILSGAAVLALLTIGFAVLFAATFTAASILPRFDALVEVRSTADAFRMSPGGASFTLLIGAALTYLSVVTYRFRKAYTD
jgi:hypothetical protein